VKPAAVRTEKVIRQHIGASIGSLRYVTFSIEHVQNTYAAYAPRNETSRIEGISGDGGT
jgi:hypothetical protein